MHVSDATNMHPVTSLLLTSVTSTASLTAFANVMIPRTTTLAASTCDTSVPVVKSACSPPNAITAAILLAALRTAVRAVSSISGADANTSPSMCSAMPA